MFKEVEREERKNGQCPNYDQTGIRYSQPSLVSEVDVMVAGLPGDATRDPGLHLGLRHHHPRRPAGDRLPLPAVLQPPLDHETVPAMADYDNLPLLRDIRLQLPFQHDLHLQIL